MSGDGMPQPIKVFVASDAAAVIEHTKCILYLEGEDIAHISEGELHIRRFHRVEDTNLTPSQAAATRSIETLELELADIMKGEFDHFMQKEIYKQPESVVNTICGCVDLLTIALILDVAMLNYSLFYASCYIFLFRDTKHILKAVD